MAAPATSLSAVEAYQPRRAARVGHIDGYRGRLGVTRWGPDSDDPVLLLHGWMDTGAAMQLLVDCLPGHWSLVALDWAGYGGSDSRQSYLMPEYLADLQCALHQLAPRKPVRLIGHSLGGTVAAIWAGLRPERTRWLVSLEGLGMGTLSAEEIPPRISEWLGTLLDPPPRRSFSSVEQLVTALLRRNPRLPPSHALFLARVWSRPVAGGIEMLADERHQGRQPFRYSRAEMEACWRQISTPALLLYGRESDYMRLFGDEQVVQRWRELVPHSQIAAIEAAAHMLQYEQPERVARHIVEFAGALS